MSRTTLQRRLPAAALLAGALLAGGAGAAQAAPPTVAATIYSPTVSGNIGSATSGVAAVLHLGRGATTVATSAPATTNADGSWTTTLPDHAPSNTYDTLTVTYSAT